MLSQLLISVIAVKLKNHHKNLVLKSKNLVKLNKVLCLVSLNVRLVSVYTGHFCVIIHNFAAIEISTLVTVNKHLPDITLLHSLEVLNKVVLLMELTNLWKGF